MANNTFPTSSLVAKTALAVLRNSFVYTPRTTRDMQSLFSQRAFNSGDTVNIKKPPRYQVGVGATLNVNDTIQDTVPLTVSQLNLGLEVTSKELMLSIDGMRQFVTPVMATFAAKIDGFVADLYKQVYTVVTPGARVAQGGGFIPAQWTGVNPTYESFLDARAAIVSNGAPDDTMFTAINPYIAAKVVNEVKALPEASSEISNQYKKGLMRIAAGFEWLESQQAPRHVNGTRTTGVTVTSYTANTITVGGAGTTTFNAGDVFYVDGVFEINKLTLQNLPTLQPFVVLNAATAVAGAATLNVSPKLVVSGNQKTISNAPAGSAPVTMSGAPSAATFVNLAWQRDAIATAFVPMTTEVSAAGGAVQETDRESGLTIRVTRDFDIVNDKEVYRFDIMFGCTMLRPELAARVQG